MSLELCKGLSVEEFVRKGNNTTFFLAASDSSEEVESQGENIGSVSSGEHSPSSLESDNADENSRGAGKGLASTEPWVMSLAASDGDALEDVDASDGGALEDVDASRPEKSAALSVSPWQYL